MGREQKDSLEAVAASSVCIALSRIVVAILRIKFVSFFCLENMRRGTNDSFCAVSSIRI